MKPSSLRKVFGIISYFPDTDSDYHVEVRRERSRRFLELLHTLEALWPDTDIMIIAQNWQDFELPLLKNKCKAYYYGKLGILGARRELRKRFLESSYDYLIMLDDDAMIAADNPQAYMDILDKHPDGVGTLRHNQSPLQLFAISKAVYSQIDMPDVDAEKGEGFEDDIFVAQCFAQFPAVAYDIPAEVVSETSFKYAGPGKCPSTWSRERKYDWNYMRTRTRTEVNMLSINVSDTPQNETPVDPTIDLIISYVNGSDKHWIQDFIKTTHTHNPSAVRFRSWGTLKYLLRSVETYMPFVRNIVLVVARPSQVPSWLNTQKVRVVYHDEFIPSSLLPTFNSCTIESFFWNIKGLSDRVIYFNDDMFPIKPLYETDFFTGDTPHIRFTDMESYSERNMFRAQCRSSIDLITAMLKLPKFEAGKIVRPYHISAAFPLKTLQIIGEQCGSILPQLATIQRNCKNVNQYIYLYYHYFTDDYVPETIDYKYFELNEKTINDIMSEILSGTHHMVCLNDSEKLKDYARVRFLLTTCFDKKFPHKSQYEL